MSSVPSQIGPYPVEAEIGRGGMGVVYRARDPKLGRPVAIKVLSEDVAGDHNRVERLRQEAKTLATLNHPNILTVHDVDTDGDALYVVTEFLEGDTLRERLATTRLDWRRAAEIGAAVADGLAAAHARGIVHRDLKPDNIFLTNDGVVKILDFGLARVEQPADAESATRTHATAPGTVLGTVGYMAPEQVRGEPADARTDIFAFGCVLYEMLTGVCAFKRDTAAESMTAILKEHPAAPHVSAPDLPSDLDRVLSRCLEKKPNDRFQSARDLAFSLRSQTSEPGSGVLSTPSGPQAVQRTRSSLIPRIALGVVALAIVAGLAWWLIGDSGPAAPAGSLAIGAIAVLPFTNQSGDAEMDFLGDGIAENVINSLAKLDGLRVAPRGAAFKHRGREGELEAVATELDVQGIVTGRVSRRGEKLVVGVELTDTRNVSQLWGERYDTSVDEILTVESDIAHRITDALRLELSGEQQAQLAKQYTTVPAAHMSYMEARHSWNQRSAEGFQRALELYDRAISADPSFALAHASKAETYALMALYTHRPSDLIPIVHEEVNTAIRLDPNLAEAYPVQSFVLTLLEWDWVGARRAIEKAIELNPKYATAHHWYSVLLEVVRDRDAALRAMEEARRLDPSSAVIATDYGRVLADNGRFDEARKALNDVIEAAPTFWRAYIELGSVEFFEGNHCEAAVLYERGREIVGEIVWVDGFAGRAYGKAGDTERAREELRRLEERAKTGYVSPMGFARIYDGLGDTDRVFEWLAVAAEQKDPFFALMSMDQHGWKHIHADPRWQPFEEMLNLP